MDRWLGKIAVVTGASSGIGATIAVELVKSGLIVVGLARRVELVEELSKKLPELLKTNLCPIKCDVTEETEIIQAFAIIESKFGGVDVLINNAGVFKFTSLISKDNSVPIRETINTNIMGLVFCSREAVQSMTKRKFGGNIIHINSVTGHYVPNIKSFTVNVYAASKHAVTALTETLRQDLNKLKSNIRVTSISPGLVRTENLGNHGQCALECVDIADAVKYVLSTPSRVQIHELTIRPIGEAF